MTDTLAKTFYRVRMQTTLEVEVEASNDEEARAKAIAVVEDEFCWNDFEPEYMGSSISGGPWDMRANIKGKTAWRTSHLSALTREGAEAEAARRINSSLWSDCDPTTLMLTAHRVFPGVQ